MEVVKEKIKIILKILNCQIYFLFILIFFNLRIKKYIIDKYKFGNMQFLNNNFIGLAYLNPDISRFKYI